MNQPTPEEQLRRLLDETVGDIEPHERLAAIRYRTQENAMPTSRRPWIWGALGAAAATAAVIGGVAVLAGGDNDAGPGPSTSPSATVTTPTDSPSESPGSSPSESPSESPSSSPSESPSHAVPVYYVGDTPRGLRLYREFQVPTEAGDPVTQAADLSVRGGATDPDYRSLWPAGTSVATSSYDGDVLTVNVESADASSGSLHDRPAGMTRAEAELAIQQVIYTAQAALGEGRPGVQFMLDGERTDQLLGVPTSEPLADQRRGELVRGDRAVAAAGRLEAREGWFLHGGRLDRQALPVRGHRRPGRRRARHLHLRCVDRRPVGGRRGQRPRPGHPDRRGRVIGRFLTGRAELTWGAPS